MRKLLIALAVLAGLALAGASRAGELSMPATDIPVALGHVKLPPDALPLEWPDGLRPPWPLPDPPFPDPWPSPRPWPLPCPRPLPLPFPDPWPHGPWYLGTH